MPPRSRTKPGSTARRPRVAGLRPPVAAPEETTEIDGPDSGTTITATDTPTAPPREAPVDTRTPDPSRSVDARATATDTTSTVATPAAASTPTETIPATDPAPADAAPTDATPTDATPTDATPSDAASTDAERTDDAPADAASTDSVATTGAATTEAAPTTEAERSEAGDDAATTRTATPTPAAKPRPARRKSAGSLTPNPSAGPAATAVKERPARSRPAPEPEREPGRLGRATRATGVAFGRFGRSRRALPITMVVVIVVCLALSGLAFWKGREAWTSGPVSNQAVIDVGTTAEIVGQTRESIEKIFSYDFTKLDDSAEAARTMSTGAFTEQYLSVFDQTIRTPATQQQLRQTATVVNIGVNSIRDDRAEVMALVQFNAQRTSTGESTNAPGLLRLDMQRVDGRWKLAQLTPLTAPR